MKDVGRVSLFAAGNLALAGVGNLLDKVTQWAHLLVTLGQVGVATVTILFILKKMRVLGKRKPKTPK